MRTAIPLGGNEANYHSRRGRSTAINCFLEKSKTGDFSRCRRAQGLQLVAEVGDGPIRGAYFAKDRVYIVSGNEVYAAEFGVGETLTPEKIGDLSRSSGVVSIYSIGTDEPEIVFVDYTEGYSYRNSDNSFVQITDADFTPNRLCTSLNQRFFFIKPESNEFFWSDISDGRTYQTLNFASAESRPDSNTGILSYKNQLYIVGELGIERWQTVQNAGTNAPVRVILGGNIERGCLSPYSIIQWEDFIIWLADDKTVRVASSTQFEKISDLSFELDVAEYPDYKEAVAYFADSTTHKIYYITFPSSGVTWGYDFSSGMWHKRATTGKDRWRVSCMVSANGKVLCGDFENGNIYLLTDDAFTDHDIGMNLKFIPPPIFYPNDYYLDELQVIADMGISDLGNVQASGQVNAEDLPATLQLRYSKDGGYTWHEKESLSLGTTGDSENMAISRGFGRCKKHSEFMLEFSSDSASEINIYQLWIDIIGGSGGNN